MDQKIQDFIEKKRIAIVGASSVSEKFGNMAAKEMIERGYEVVFVHPSAKE